MASQPTYMMMAKEAQFALSGLVIRFFFSIPLYPSRHKCMGISISLGEALRVWGHGKKCNILWILCFLKSISFRIRIFNIIRNEFSTIILWILIWDFLHIPQSMEAQPLEWWWGSRGTTRGVKFEYLYIRVIQTYMGQKLSRFFLAPTPYGSN